MCIVPKINEEYYITLIQSCIDIHVANFYQVDCIEKSRKIPGLKQRNIHEQRHPQ